MILIFRKYIVRILLYMSFLSFIALLLWYYLLADKSFPLRWTVEQPWWAIYNKGADPGFIKLASLAGQILFSCLAGLVITRQIKRNPSAELSFFYLFLFSFSLQIFRIPFFNESSFFTASGLATRIIYFSRILALSSLFAASLFSSGLQIQKFGMVLLICLLTAFTLSALIPVNSSLVSGSLLNRIAREKHMALFCLTLEFLSIMNYISAGHKQGRSEYYRLALFSVFIILGYEFLFFLSSNLIIPGFLCLTGGTVLFTSTSRKLFLWS